MIAHLPHDLRWRMRCNSRVALPHQPREAIMNSDALFAIYAQRGSVSYFGEAVSMSEHSLQAGHFAQARNAPDALVVAALLHDIGHLIETVPDDIADWKTDAHHEIAGSRWLTAHFGSEVCEPVRLHVPAKRYLCATDPAYFGQLSAASVLTLNLQGGPMSPAEARAFEAEPYWREAIVVRQCDDQGKIAGLRTPDFSHYRNLIEHLAASAAAQRALHAAP
jgi:[1-hydroxy-2-(trimethylamino)ethyl]phosphonate dioxygenase